MKKINIEQVESSIAEELDKPLKAALKRHGYPIHESLRLRLSLLNSDGRKKRSNAVAHAWSPEKSEPAQFWLEPSTATEMTPVAEVVREAEPADTRLRCRGGCSTARHWWGEHCCASRGSGVT